ncbi:MAG: hypothetical protein WBO31_15510, partial [Saprospiraceae bacterium]
MIQFRPFRWVIVGLFSFILSTLIFSQYDPYLQIRVDVVYLSSDDLQGRETGTEGEVMAAEYIQSRMSKIGLSPKGNEDWL